MTSRSGVKQPRRAVENLRPLVFRKGSPIHNVTMKALHLGFLVQSPLLENRTPSSRVLVINGKHCLIRKMTIGTHRQYVTVVVTPWSLKGLEFLICVESNEDETDVLDFYIIPVSEFASYFEVQNTLSFSRRLTPSVLLSFSKHCAH